MKKIAEIQPKGVARMTIYYDNKTSVNPYRVYLEWMELGHYGLSERRRQVVRYANLASAAAQLAQYATQHDEEGR